METKSALTNNEVSKTDLNTLIEEERAEMYRLSHAFGYNDERTLRQSEKLDCLLLEAIRLSI
ncbi:MAG: aspartyl-phosphate phosphatase Spo0E family protein [Dethiobacter sp.]|jgi:hypothetical protein|nr:aspartyl-phosphate phosphatase Spo0E family protein [Dethiobacter sp.]